MTFLFYCQNVKHKSLASLYCCKQLKKKKKTDIKSPTRNLKNPNDLLTVFPSII